MRVKKNTKVCGLMMPGLHDASLLLGNENLKTMAVGVNRNKQGVSLLGSDLCILSKL